MFSLLVKLVEILYALYFSVAFLLFTLISWPFIYLLPERALRLYLKCAGKAFWRITGNTLEIKGEFPRVTGPVIIVCNHASYLDGVILYAYLPLDFSFIAKRELNEHWFTAFPLRRLHTIFVDRRPGGGGTSALKNMYKALEAGDSLLIFPEGTFKSEPGILPFRSGAFYVSERKERPLLLLALKGTREMLPSGSWFVKRGRVEIVVGGLLKPWEISKSNEEELVESLKQRAYDFITQASGEGPR